MAVYYYLAVACSDQAAADAISAYFQGVSLVIPPDLSVNCDAFTIQDWVGAWWSTVRPYGASINAFDRDGKPEPNLVTPEQRSEIGRALYDLLRTSPAFSYARYGAEALDDFFDVYSTYNRILRDPKLIVNGWEGLVISESLWEQTGFAISYEPFRPGYFWAPYRRE